MGTQTQATASKRPVKPEPFGNMVFVTQDERDRYMSALADYREKVKEFEENGDSSTAFTDMVMSATRLHIAANT